MIKVCTLKGPRARGGVGQCWAFPNARLKGALDFARIGSANGRVRRVTVCGRLVRVYSDGQKVAGAMSMANLRRRARSCR